MPFIRPFILVVAPLLLSACASMLNGKYQAVTVVPVGGDFETDHCTLKNDRGEWQRLSGSQVLVRRDNGPLDIRCEGDNREGVASVESKTQWRYYWANFMIWDLCTISCIVDISTGSFFDYPHVIEVPMKSLAPVAAAVPIEAPLVEPRPDRSISEYPQRSEAPEPVRSEPQLAAVSSAAANDARMWQIRAEALADARDCVDLRVEQQASGGAMYSMLCRGGRELMMCSSGGCRVVD